MTQALSTIINITYEGKDITRNIAPYLLGFTFTDNSGGKADDLSITLQDEAGTWLRDWLPSKGDIISASIIKTQDTAALSLPCGTFSVDQIDYSFPPSVFAIKGVSSSIKKQVSQVKKSRTWENVTLSEVIGDIAAENGFSLMMDSCADGHLEYVDQIEQSDLEFLQTLCADYGQTVKVQEGRIIVYDLAEYEAKTPALEVSREDERLISARFSSKSAQVYKKAHVRYHDPVNDETYDAEYEDDAEEGSERELEICERVESQSDAERLAEQRLNAANRKEITGSIVLIGDVRLAAGETLQVSGFGMFSGRHFITKCTHKVDTSGYTTTLELGQPQSEKAKGKARKTNRKAQSVHPELFYEGEHYY